MHGSHFALKFPEIEPLGSGQLFANDEICVFVSLRGAAMGVAPAILVHAVPQPLFFGVFKQTGRLFFLFSP